MSEENELKSICYALAESCKVRPKLFQRLLITYGDPANMYAQNPADLAAMVGIDQEKAKQIIETQYQLERTAEEIDRLRLLDIEYLSFFDSRYPQSLRRISEPPLALYLRGDQEMLNRGGLAIVGTTAADHENIRAAVEFGKATARSGRNVVSGLAAGIDSAAHLGCIQAEGKTAAVLGCGLLNIYPEENSGLAKIIGETGALLSEYNIYAEAVPPRLVARNRLIVALSDAVLIVQVGESRRGELHAAAAAIEQGKPVFIWDPDNRYAGKGQVDNEDWLDDSYYRIEELGQLERIFAIMTN